ncbi:ABC transporter substrate-binding protein [Alicyclobacillus sp. SP_1]|uniref:ABC transporter substrate-binding protein n=1 Tax=Alicyclobacillus sp. SP_1 TaxID=2942475 RepID=UPI002157F943|nr:ABC transporter substrate-binding protein [Alicyclobacillus sp. SP_1]
MLKRHLLAVWSLSTAVLVLGVAGCGTTPSANTTAKTSVTSNENAGPHVGGSISINASPHGPWADVFNPYVPGENQDDIVPDIYEPLVQWNGTNGTDLPWLAKSWSWNKSKTVLTVHLQHGVTWSNGKPFTSKDVVFTMDMLKKYPAIDGNALWSYMTSIKANGKYQVQVTLKKPNATFFYYFSETLIVPKFQFEGKNPVTYKDSHPIGTGPYMLKTFNSQQITLTRNPHYWQKGKPYLETVYYPAETSNESTILGLATGKIDWATIFSPDLKTSFVAKNPADYHISTDSSGFDDLYLNLQDYPLNELVVRKAISMAINRHLLSVIGESGYSTPASQNGVGTSMAAEWSTPSLQAKYAAVFDPTKAKEMLLHAGFTMKNGVMMTPKGQPFTIDMDVPAPFSDFVTMSSQIKSMLGAIGIQVNEDTVSANEYLTKLETGDFQAGICWTPSGPNPYFTQNGLMNTKFSGPIGKTAVGMNYERYSNPEVQTLSGEFNATENPQKQKKIIAELGKIMATQLPVITLLNRNEPIEYSTATIAGWPTSSNPYWNAAADSGPIVVLTHLYQK